MPEGVSPPSGSIELASLPLSVMIGTARQEKEATYGADLEDAGGADHLVLHRGVLEEVVEPEGQEDHRRCVCGGLQGGRGGGVSWIGTEEHQRGHQGRAAVRGGAHLGGRCR